MSENRASTSTYLTVFIALMALLALTVWVATFDLGPRAGLLVALAIAVSKAVMILLYFMGVRYSSQRVWLFSSAGFFWLIIMLGILDDFVTRH